MNCIWCVVSSAVPGETVVTAYAPGVFDWDKGRVNVRLAWGDASNFEFDPDGITIDAKEEVAITLHSDERAPARSYG